MTRTPAPGGALIAVLSTIAGDEAPEAPGSVVKTARRPHTLMAKAIAVLVGQQTSHLALQNLMVLFTAFQITQSEA